MNHQVEQMLEDTNLGIVLARYPRVGDMLMGLHIDVYDEELPLFDNLEGISEKQFIDFGTTRLNFVDEVADAIGQANQPQMPIPIAVRDITVTGGTDKQGNREIDGTRLERGEVVAIVGATGSGKSCLLSDIESLSQNDTPSHRQILVNGKPPENSIRMSLGTHLVAQLSQNMNFIMDLSVRRFLETHASARGNAATDSTVREVYDYANTLSGEEFALDTSVTQLSGGQSRALMIADTLLLSESPIILMDEIENAGIDRRKAVDLLSRNDKIVLIATHDPLLVLSCNRRLVVKNGGIVKVIESTAAEQRNRAVLDAYDKKIVGLRELIRNGDAIDMDVAKLLATPM